jgi:sugar lactone lactonase YvrE
VTTDTGVAQFDGERWTTRFAPGWFDGLSIARDGTVWLTGPSGIHRLPPD